MGNFSHLHLHSTYSILDGIARIEEIISRAKELGQTAISCTDHGSTSGLWVFQKEAKKQGIKPILGTEFYYQRENDDGNGHLIVLAKNNKGLQNIFKLQEYAYVNNFYKKPRIDWNTLVQFKEGLVVLSACLASTFAQHLMLNEYDEAVEWATKFKEEFGNDFYLEIQPNGIPEQWEVNKYTISIANKLGIKYVATNDVHYVYKDDCFPHEVQLAMQTKKKMNDPKRWSFPTNDFWMRSREEMMESFQSTGISDKDIELGLDTTQEIVDKCNAEIIPGKYLPSYYDVPEGMTSRNLLAKRIVEGAKRTGFIKNKEYMKEVQSELDVIDEEGYSDYFLIVQDYVTSARARGETVGDGRGSGAGSKVVYLLDITKLEPFKYNLLFERFMAKGREPDIDQDFSNQEAVFKDLQSKYGTDSVARIITFGTMTPKAVFRKVMSTFDHDIGTINYLSKQIPDGIPDIETACTISDALGQAQKDFPIEFKVMSRLQFTISHEGKHAGGVVIYNQLSNHLPIKTLGEDRNDRIVAFDMDVIHELHFFKFDILGLETIKIINNTLLTINKNIDLNTIDYNDENVYDDLCKGDVSGVFQLSNQRQKVIEQQPRSFIDLVAINALIRPGTGDWEEYLARRGGKEYSLHPDRKYYLKETEGLLVYQEQFLLDAQVFAGWDIAYADSNIRKNRNILEDYDLRDKFYLDSKERGYDEETVMEIWNEIVSAVSGGYGFNKSHSATYTRTAYQTAWLKHYYPNEFYASLMSFENTDTDGQTAISGYIAELKDRGIIVNPPDINISNENFVVTDKGINYRITAITHVGESAIKGIMAIRPVISLSDLLERRKKKDIKGNTIVNLIKAGCFDFENPNREEMMYNFLMSQRKPKQIKEEYEVERLEWNDKLKCKWEKDALGLYLSVHPMEKYGFKPLSSFDENQYDVLQGGEIADIRIFNDKNKNEMAFVNIDTLYGIVKVIIFASTWDKKEIRECIIEGNIIMVKGKKSGNSILLNEVEVLE